MSQICSKMVIFLFQPILEAFFVTIAVLDLGLISIGSLGPRTSTKVESHVNFTESQKVSQANFFLQY